MSFRKEGNKRNGWLSYCQSNNNLIDKLNVPEWVFRNELNFREFVTSGKTNGENPEFYNFELLKHNDSILFWQLFDFITYYFELDMSYFDAFETARIKKSNNS